MAKKEKVIPPAAPMSASLYFTEGSSDKEYHAQLECKKSPDDWVVKFQYGARGQSLKAGVKTEAPIPFAEAYIIYDDLVASKMKKGYTPDESGSVFQDTVAGAQFSGCLPQLPQTVRDVVQVSDMIHSDAWWMQEKFDGENRQIRVTADGAVQGINKRGIVVALPQPLADGFSKVPGPFLGSGEIIGEVLHLFDVQEFDGKNLRSKPYRDRLVFVDKAATLATSAGAQVNAIHTVKTAAEKRAHAANIRENSGEGVVYKRADAPFTEGKLSATQSDQFKDKFTEDCTVRVRAVSKGKRSVEMEIDGPDGVMPMGSISIPPNHNIPAPGDLISVVYLHLFEGGSLFQPQYKGVRTDCDGPDTIDQFKMKLKEPVPTAKRPKP